MTQVSQYQILATKHIEEKLARRNTIKQVDNEFVEISKSLILNNETNQYFKEELINMI